MDVEQVLKDFQDHLAPRLDTYEQAIYLYLFRHSRLIGLEEAVVGFKSARRRMACGIGEKGKPMSEHTAYEKLQSLQQKGCIAILDTNRDGRRIRLSLPSEIPGVVRIAEPAAAPDLETEDFFAVENRDRILAREGHRCFYCLRQLNSENYVIEHVVSRPHGNGSYRNVVAAAGSATIGRVPRPSRTGCAPCTEMASSMRRPSKNGCRTLSGFELVISSLRGGRANNGLQRTRHG